MLRALLDGAPLAGKTALVCSFGRKRLRGRRGTEPERPTGQIEMDPLARWSPEDLEPYRRLRDLSRHPQEPVYRSVARPAPSRSRRTERSVPLAGGDRAIRGRIHLSCHAP